MTAPRAPAYQCQGVAWLRAFALNDVPLRGGGEFEIGKLCPRPEETFRHPVRPAGWLRQRCPNLVDVAQTDPDAAIDWGHVLAGCDHRVNDGPKLLPARVVGDFEGHGVGSKRDRGAAITGNELLL